MMQPANADGRTEKQTVVVVGEGMGRETIQQALKDAGQDVVVVDSLPAIEDIERPKLDPSALILADPAPQADPIDDFAAQVAAMPEEVPDPDANAMPPFNVPNRSRAEKVVEKIYGAGVRLRFPKKENAGQVQIVHQQGPKSVVLRQAATLTELLSEPVESYVKGGKDLKDTESRILSLEYPVTEFIGGRKVQSLSITLGAMAFRACSQFPEYKEKRQREYDRYRRSLQAQIAKARQDLSALADESREKLAALEG